MELLDSNEQYMSSLTTPDMTEQDNEKGWIAEDTTAQAHEITLPSEECKGCTVSYNQVLDIVLYYHNWLHGSLE